MPDPARIAQAQVLEIPVTIQGEKTAAETGQREPFAESTKTTLTFDNGAVLKLQARVKAGESVSLRNEKSGKEIQCKVLEAPAEGQLGYTDLEFLETVHDFWEGHAEQAEAAGEKPQASVAKSDAESAAEKPAPAAAAAETERAAKAEPAVEKPEPAKSEAAVAVPEAFVAARAEAHAPEETEAAADNSLAMMSAAASEASLPPVKAPAPEEKPEEQKPHAPQAQIPKGRLREELVPTHEMVPDNPSAPTVATAPTTPSTPSATVPTGEQIDAALRVMEGAARPQGAAEPSDAKDQANLAALMAREARLAKYAALKDKAASQIGRGQPPPGALKAAEAPAGEAGASVEGEAEVEVGPPKVPLSERLTTGKNAVIVEIVAGVAIAVALGFIWHAVRGLIIHPSDRPVAVAAAPVKKAVPPKAPPVVVQTPAAPVEKVAAAIPPAPVNAPAARPTVVASAPVAKASAAKASAATPSVVASAPASKTVQPAPARSESAEETGPRVVEPPPVTEEPKPAGPVAPKAPEDIPAKILSAPQPGFPSWAKTLDVASVVKLDAVIDEKGNLGQTKIVSGPRLLERAAQQAVQLWIFEPAELDGKPAASHMVLTVEFQR
jgi:outer membrane biosynthesis protein TonB